MGQAVTKANMQNKEEFFNVLSEFKEKFESMQPELEVTVRDPEMGVEGYIVVWNTGISKGGKLDGCGKGGTRIIQTLNIDEVKMLARTMALKNAGAGLRLGGAKSGMRADPNDPDFEKKYRRFVSLCKPFLHENGGPFGGFGFDIGAQPIHAIWACDELGSTRSFTGKPADMGGTDYDRHGHAGLGVATSAKAMIEAQDDTVAGKAFGVQGIGAMGGAVIRYFTEYGGQLRAIADPKYGGTWLFDAAPSDELIKAIVEHDSETIQMRLETEGRLVDDSVQAVLFQELDVLFPCAVQNVITETNSYEIKAKYIAEGANQPTTKEAYPMLMEKGIHVVPDFIANPGGIIAAYVELTSENEDKVQEAKDYTIRKITDNVNRMVALSRQYDIETVHAGQYLAFDNMLNGID